MKELFEKDVPLAKYTSIGLGGPAKYFFRASSLEELVDAVRLSREMKIRHLIIGGGTNIVFSDDGFDGLVIRNEFTGITIDESKDHIVVSANSGENWDELVKKSVSMKLTGIECLSGIPGTTGATPVQNVGAYGQEVSDTIVTVHAVDLKSYELVMINNRNCKFSYRFSRFKGRDKGKYFIYKIDYKLSKKDEPVIKYEELNNALTFELTGFEDLSRADKIKAIRKKVVEIRKRKSMVIDKKDPDSKSCGSFFTNPVVTLRQFEKLREENYPELNEARYHQDGTMVKIPAAWLVENAGFRKGYEIRGAAISSKHTLALVNKGTTSKDLINLSEEIISSVKEKFGILLQREPDFIGK